MILKCDDDGMDIKYIDMSGLLEFEVINYDKLPSAKIQTDWVLVKSPISRTGVKIRPGYSPEDMIRALNLFMWDYEDIEKKVIFTIDDILAYYEGVVTGKSCGLDCDCKNKGFRGLLG